MGFSDCALDAFVAQQMSTFIWVPRSVGSEFPNRATWLDEFVLRRILHAHVPDDRVALALITLRRVLAAIEEWESMCVAASGATRRPSVYFSALRHCEGCVAAAWQALEFGRKALDQRLFDKGDGTVYERLNAVHNVGRHFDPEALPRRALHAVWLAGECVRTHEHELHLEELREVVCMLGRIGSELVAGPTQPASTVPEPPTRS